jgi:hypothetical protein
MKRHPVIGVWMLWVMAACASGMQVHIEPGSEGAKLASRRVFDWVANPLPDLQDRRLDPVMIDRRIRGAVNTRLAAMGYEKAGPRPAQVLVAYHVAMERRLARTEIDHVYGYGASRGAPRVTGEVPVAYEQGTLVLDFIDVDSGKLLWRGWAQGQVVADLDPAERQRRIDEAVHRILERLPRGN